MTRTSLAAAALAVALMSGTALAGEATPKAGEPAPELGAAKWVANQPERTTLESMRGEVVLIEWWGVNCPPCCALIPHIESLQQEKAKDGLNILAFEVQNHTADQIKAKLGEMGGKTYPVAAGPTGKYDCGGPIPHAWLVGVDGKIAWEGNPSAQGAEMEAVLDAEMAKVKYPRLGKKDLDKSLSGAAAKFAKHDLTGARKEAQKVADKDSASEGAKADARLVLDRITAIAERQAAAAKAAEGEKRWLDASDLYALLAQTLKGAPEGDAAAARAKEIKADDAAQKEIKAAEALRKLCAELDGKPADVRKAQLDAFAKSKKYEGTRAASDAATMAGKA